VRPLKLTLKGFTAFRDETELDFSRVDLIAIAGPTGAGKSSLLDAITFALYGRVERVGEQVSQLISQGLPQMAVALEFTLGVDRWLVTRRTQRPTAKTAVRTSVVLQRKVDGEWISEAGQVREVDERIKKLIGLDYAGFTRAVLLPQGKFDQFLAGDAKERRRILNDLLGLWLFERMARHANRLASEASQAHRARVELLANEYKGVTDEAVAAARERASELSAREQRLNAAQKVVRDVMRRRDDARRAIGELRACAADAGRHAETSNAAARTFSTLGRDLATAETALAAAATRLTEANVAATREQEAFTKATEKWGTPRDLAAASRRASDLATARDDLAETQDLATTAEATLPKLRTAATAVGQAAGEAEKAERGRKDDLSDARAALRHAEHDHRVAAIARGLKRGDICPVCGETLKTTPKLPPSTSLDRATKAVERAEAVLEAAQKHARAAADRAGDASRDVAHVEKAIAGAKQKVVAQKERVESLEIVLKKVLGAKLPPDPVGAIDQRIGVLENLDKVARDAERAAVDRERDKNDAARTREALAHRVDTERLRLPVAAADTLVARVRTLAPGAPVPTFAVKTPTGAPALGTFAKELATEFLTLAKAIEAAVAERVGSETSFLAEAHKAVGDLVAPTETLDALGTAVDDGVRRAAAEGATAKQSAADLSEKLVRRAELERELETFAARADVLRDLALDLKQDQIVDFLQAEALRTLAVEGSNRLAYLSADRYRLKYREDEFYVVDTWNGDEERSARTLSGGETFLASLALALTLSEQVRSLAITERARLDSLFLDEGFSTLDPETLRSVLESIDRLGGDGRLVGVISHIREFTSEFPARIEVEKSQRGSRLRLVAI